MQVAIHGAAGSMVGSLSDLGQRLLRLIGALSCPLKHPHDGEASPKPSGITISFGMGSTGVGDQVSKGIHQHRVEALRTPQKFCEEIPEDEAGAHRDPSRGHRNSSYDLSGMCQKPFQTCGA